MASLTRASGRTVTTWVVITSRTNIVPLSSSDAGTPVLDPSTRRDATG